MPPHRRKKFPLVSMSNTLSKCSQTHSLRHILTCSLFKIESKNPSIPLERIARERSEINSTLLKEKWGEKGGGKLVNVQSCGICKMLDNSNKIPNLPLSELVLKFGIKKTMPPSINFWVCTLCLTALEGIAELQRLMCKLEEKMQRVVLTLKALARVGEEVGEEDCEIVRKDAKIFGGASLEENEHDTAEDGNEDEEGGEDGGDAVTREEDVDIKQESFEDLNYEDEEEGLKNDPNYYLGYNSRGDDDSVKNIIMEEMTDPLAGVDDPFESGPGTERPPNGFFGRASRKSKVKANQLLKTILNEDTLDRVGAEVEGGRGKHSVKKVEKDENEDFSNYEEEDDEDEMELLIPPPKRRIISKKLKISVKKTKKPSKAIMGRPTRVTGPIICEPCGGKSFPTQSMYSTHKTRFHDPHVCSHCGKGFKCRKTWTDHVRNKHEGVKHHKCVYCLKEFYKKSGHDEHLAVCLKNPDKDSASGIVFKCKICGESFLKSSIRKNHVARVHKRINTSCPICAKPIKWERNIRLHMETHKSIQERLNCTKCEGGIIIKFKSFDAKLEHDQRVHEGKKTHGCGICGKTFARPFQLKDHIEQKHGSEEERKPACGICGVRCNSRKELNSHKKWFRKKGKDCREVSGIRRKMMQREYGENKEVESENCEGDNDI